MKEFDVKVTETLEKTVTVEAASKSEAQEKVSDAWDRQDFVLGADDLSEVAFETADGREIDAGKETIDVLLVPPGDYPRKVTIGTDLEDLQEVVGGDIEVTYPFQDDTVGILLNEEGKLIGLPANRAARSDDGDIYDIYVGNFLVVGLTEDSFGSLTPQQMETYEEMFHQPELFVRMGRGIAAIPMPDDMVDSVKQRSAAAPEKEAKPKRPEL